MLGATNRGKRDQKYRQLKGFQIGVKKLQIGAELTNRGKRDYKPGQGLNIGGELCFLLKRKSFSFSFPINKKHIFLRSHKKLFIV